LIAVYCLSAAPLKAAGEEDSSKFRFLQSVSSQFKKGADYPTVETLPKETEEERDARENIRSVLRLVDGDVVELDSGRNVRFVSVPDEDFSEVGTQYSVPRVQKWLDTFLKDPEQALNAYGSDGLSVSQNEDGQFVYYHLYFPKKILDEIRTHQVERYDALMEKRRERLQPKVPVKPAPPPVTVPAERSVGDRGWANPVLATQRKTSGQVYYQDARGQYDIKTEEDKK
jgi:hypothetical protein